jgi:hypothetical protein
MLCSDFRWKDVTSVTSGNSLNVPVWGETGTSFAALRSVFAERPSSLCNWVGILCEGFPIAFVPELGPDKSGPFL